MKNDALVYQLLVEPLTLFQGFGLQKAYSYRIKLYSCINLYLVQNKEVNTVNLKFVHILMLFSNLYQWLRLWAIASERVTQVLYLAVK